MSIINTDLQKTDQGNPDCMKYGIQEGALVSWSKIWDRTNRVLLARLKITLVVMLRSGVALTRDPLCHVTYD